MRQGLQRAGGYRILLTLGMLSAIGACLAHFWAHGPRGGCALCWLAGVFWLVLALDFEVRLLQPATAPSPFALRTCDLMRGVRWLPTTR